MAQADADAIAPIPHVKWTNMLTVWRKLHVEVDSMGPVDWSAANATTSNAQANTIQSAPVFAPATSRATIEIEDVDGDFEQTDQHRVGRVDITGFGSFITVNTILSVFPYNNEHIVIANAPSAIVNANGANYTLWDDDIGSDPTLNPPFVLAGFDAPPVTLPKVPDTSLMAQVYKDAYVDVPAPDMQYYDANTPFDRNVRNNSEAGIKGNFNRDLTSEASFWAVHITATFQGYVDKDNDPDTEQGLGGLQYGITGATGLFGGGRAGSLVHLETIRDDRRANAAAMGVIERYTVVHESGHQFLLEHEDGRFPNPSDTDPSDDYIMTDKLDQTGMAPNVAFSANSINKIRNIAYPPQGE